MKPKSFKMPPSYKYTNFCFHLFWPCLVICNLSFQLLSMQNCRQLAILQVSWKHTWQRSAWTDVSCAVCICILLMALHRISMPRRYCFLSIKTRVNWWAKVASEVNSNDRGWKSWAELATCMILQVCGEYWSKSKQLCFTFVSALSKMKCEQFIQHDLIIHF